MVKKKASEGVFSGNISAFEGLRCRYDHNKGKAITGGLASSARSWKPLRPQRYSTEIVSPCEETLLMLQILGCIIIQAVR